jgi:YHS domain-containing protein
MRIVPLFVAVILLVTVQASCSAQNKSGAPAQKQEQTAKAVDPVCGMQVDPAKAAGKSEYKGTTYYFCSDQCKKTFDANPAGVLKKDSKKK